MNGLGRGLIILGLVLAAVGLLLVLAPRIPLLGKLPGDIVVRKKGFTFYLPLATSLVLSLILSFILNLFRK